MRTVMLASLLLLPCLLILACDKSTEPDTGQQNDPVLLVGVNSLQFATNQNTLTFTIANTGTKTLNWTIADDADWISVDKVGGSTTTDTAQVTAVVDRVGLGVGAHTCSIIVSSNGGSLTIPVTLDASPLVLSAYDFYFEPSDSVLTFEINNTGAGALNWTLSADQDWIVLDPVSGSTTAETDFVSIRFDSTLFDAGTSPGTITVFETGAKKNQAPGGSGSVKWGGCEAKVAHYYYGRPRLRVLSEGINELRCWSQTEVDLLVGNRAINSGDPLDWIATVDQPWLTVTPNSGRIPYDQIESTTVLISVDKSGFDRGGLYYGLVTISSNGGYGQVRVRCSDPIVAVSPTSLDFGEEETSLSLTILNEGSGALYGDWFGWSIDASESWMTVSKDQGDLSLDHPEEEIDVMVNRDGLDPGIYDAELTVSSLCSSQDQIETKTVAVSMEVAEKEADGTLVMGLSHYGQMPYDLNDVLTIEFNLEIDEQKNITGSGIGTHTTLEVTSNTEYIEIRNVQSVPMPFTFTGTASGDNNENLDFVIVPPEPAETYAYSYELCVQGVCERGTDTICPAVVIWNQIHFVVANESGATMDRAGVEDFGGGGFTYDWYFNLEIHKKQ